MTVDARKLRSALEELEALRTFERGETKLYDLETETTIAKLEHELQEAREVR